MTTKYNSDPRLDPILKGDKTKQNKKTPVKDIIGPSDKIGVWLVN